ncbi:MAG: prolyl oligopeptidase family serine peptidase [Planctomycetales bacterium]
MKRSFPLLMCSLILFGLMAVPSAPAADFKQTENIVYSEVHGIALVMDVFTPTGPKNGLGIIDVISGAWHSDRGKIKDHMLAQTFAHFGKKGYTVFAIRPGSITKFSAIEMRENLEKGILWVKAHASDYGVDPNRLGMMGASAGGHLALLTAVNGPTETKPDDLKNTRVKAVGVFFPPTNLLSFKRDGLDLASTEGFSGMALALALPRKPTIDTTLPKEKKEEFVKQASPALLVKPGLPPMLLIHGDADKVVPLAQSEEMVEALKKANVPVELIVKKGGGHPWLTISEEMKILADWFDKQL